MTHPDLLWQSRVQLPQMGAMNPLLAWQQGAHLQGLNSIHARLMQTKMPSSFGGLMGGFTMGNPALQLATSLGGSFVTSPISSMQRSPGLSSPTRKVDTDSVTVDLRKSSIDQLRLKAKEHSTNIETHPTS